MSTANPGVHPIDAGKKREYVRSMFTSIAPKYDFLNHLLSLNIDKSWRRAAVDMLGYEQRPTGSYLDLCAGTMDLAAELAGRSDFSGKVFASDFVAPMLQLGTEKTGLPAVGADSLAAPFPDNTFDGCTVGFGVRNLVDLDAGIAEMFRLVKPGGRMVILEFCTPTFLPLRWAYLSYFKFILPAVGRLVSRHDSAYDYLPNSVLAFPSPGELSERVAAAGFTDVSFRTLTMGIAAIHRGTKP